MDADSIDRILDVMDEAASSLAMQEAGCRALGRLCTMAEGTARERIGSSGAIGALVRAVNAKGFLSNVARLRKLACEALTALVVERADAREHDLTLNAVMKDHICRCDIFGAVISTLKAHRKAPAVLVNACNLVAVICSGDDPYDERKNMASASGLIQAIVQVLRKNLKLSDVQDAGRRALIVICHNTELQTYAACSKLAHEPICIPCTQSSIHVTLSQGGTSERCQSRLVSTWNEEHSKCWISP